MASKKIIDDSTIPVLDEDDYLKVSVRDADGPTCVVTFAGVGMDVGGARVQREDFAELGIGIGPQVFVFDKTRSWGNRINFDQLSELVAPFTHDRRVVCLGVSMGGFLGIVASRYLDAEVCIALGPQYSVHPDIMPMENRWPEFTSLIEEWKLPSLDGQFSDTCRYYCFFTGIEAEAEHIVRLPCEDHIHRFLVPGYIHNVAKELQKHGALYPLLGECLRGVEPSGLPLESQFVDGIHFIPKQALTSFMIEDTA